MYEKNNAGFSEEVFQNPPSEYRGAPFWSWNGKLDKERLEKQILYMKQMGFGGYHIHSRIGLETEYLGEEFLELVKHCTQFGAENDMLTWLYDEDKWPSGAGGGRVTEDNRYASRYLLFSQNYYPDGYLDRKIVPTSRLTKNGVVTMICRYEVNLDNGKLLSYRRLQEGENAVNVWYAYRVVTEPLSWFNNQPYVDTLNPEAIQKFIAVTHEPYYQAVGQYFAKTVPAIFTDEPSFHKQEFMVDGAAGEDVGIAYTDNLEMHFCSRYGYSLLDHLPEVFWERADGALSQIRYHYYDCVAWLFSEAYGKTLGDWCDAHNLLLTGHLLFEDKLQSQSEVVGDVMRTLRHFTLPGIDMLADRHEYTTAKQAQSVARQYSRAGVSSELYGVTNWDYDFRGHKHQGDWQAALGVTVRVPHLVWMSMSGESKRDYPSPLDEHTTWYQKYPLIEDHFARLNAVLSRGRAHCRIAVIHPLESYWMLMGPMKDTAYRRQELEDVFQDITQWLLFDLLDFDYANEALLPELYQKSVDGKLHLGAMAYDVVVVPGMITMRNTTLQALKDYSEAGGTVIFFGNIPRYLDGQLSEAVIEFAKSCTCVGHDKYRLLHELEFCRDLDIQDAGYQRSKRLIYQMRQDGEEKWLFVAQGKHDDRMELSHWVVQTGREDFTFRVRGTYSAELADTANGSFHPQHVMHKDGWTYMRFGLYAQDSVLLRLHPTKLVAAELLPTVPPQIIWERYLPSEVDYHLEEDNVMVLDQAQYSLDNGPWQPREEILRLDDQVRRSCGYRLRTASFPQPWLEPTKSVEHSLKLRFTVESQIEVPDVDLAFEGQTDTIIYWNGRPISWKPGQHYIDTQIHRVHLGALQMGINILEIMMPFGSGTNVENCYLLGKFGVRVVGDRSVAIALPDKLAFGDLVPQGLAFYGGNIEYRCKVCMEGGDLALEIPEYNGALLEVYLDNQMQNVYAEPYLATFGDIPAGEHMLRIRLFGNRINTFGQLHNSNRKERYFGPKTWRTTGKNWSYNYQLRKTGILLPPILRRTQGGEE